MLNLEISHYEISVDPDQRASERKPANQYSHMGESFQNYSLIQHFEADFP